MQWIRMRPWPGNVRELRNAVERLALLSENDTIDVPVLEEYVGMNVLDSAREIDRMARSILALPTRIGSKLDVIERAVLHHAVEITGGNKSAAARLLGVHRKFLERRLERASDPAKIEGKPTRREGDSRKLPKSRPCSRLAPLGARRERTGCEGFRRRIGPLTRVEPRCGARLDTSVDDGSRRELTQYFRL
jgi:hypothetical protein